MSVQIQAPKETEEKSQSLLKNRLAMRWGGAAGNGLQSTGLLLQKYFNRLGYYVFGIPGTQSTIRGGHVWQHVEVSSQPIYSHDQLIDVLVALNTVTLETHLRDMKQGSILLYDETKVLIDKYKDELTEKEIRAVKSPFFSIAREIEKSAPVLANTVSVGTVLYLLGLPLDPYVEMIEKRFKNKEEVIELNKNALYQGMEFAKTVFTEQFFLEQPVLEPRANIVLNGNEAFSFGAAAAGVKFLSQYPITPASSILKFLSLHAEEFGIVVKQAEDELAAINMAIGASFAGARALTATSGPGLSLKSEGLGYASMTETPVVLAVSMRGGPSTGVPTKMEQADLLPAVFASHGEGPRVVLAPRSIENAYEIAYRAFNIAEKYSVPVIVLLDFALSERTKNVPPFDINVPIERGKIWEGPTEEYPVFKRYQLTDDGVSPRAFPPTKGGNYILVGAEHDEFSNSLSGNRCGLPESWYLRVEMIKKRFRKMQYLKQELQPPELYGPPVADYTIITWGSTYGATREAIDRLNNETEYFWNMLSFTDLHPLPTEKVKPFLDEIKHGIMLEVNYTGQFERILKNEFCWTPIARIQLLTGEAPTPYQIVREAINIVKNLEE